MTDYFELTDCPYLGWAHYLPKLPFNPSAAVITKVPSYLSHRIIDSFPRILKKIIRFKPVLLAPLGRRPGLTKQVLIL